MGQKTNPIIFQLGKTKTWKSNYFEKKSQDSETYAYNDLEIRKFINKFFKNNGLLVNYCKIIYSSDNLINIFVSYYVTSQSLYLIKNFMNKQKKNMNSFKKTKNLRLKNYVQNLIKYQKHLNYRKTAAKRFPTKILKQKKKLRYQRLYKIKRYKTYTTSKKYKQIIEKEHHSFFESFFESLHSFLGKNVKILLTVKQINKNLKKSFQITKRNKKELKKNFINLRRYNRNSYFKEGINNLFFVSNQNKSANLLAKFIITQLKKIKKNHKFFFKFLKSTLYLFKHKKLSKIKSIKIKIKGKIFRSRRARQIIIMVGKEIPVLSITSNIDYSEETAFTSKGSVGVKVWVYYPN